MSKVITLPKDTVLGKKMFGGYVYSLDCSFGGFNGRSSLTLTCVSESGLFTKPTLSNNLQTIQIGAGVSFKGKLISYNKTIKPGNSILEVVYKDGSDILDKIYVGLHLRHGNKNYNRSKSLIIVGKEYHPCDTNLDSLVFSLENSKVDWCDPCPFYPENKYKNTCSDDASLQIQDVKYTFNELLQQMSSKGLNTKNLPSIENVKKFPRDYSGSLRSVLQQWCSDFGISFYWDWQTDQLSFVDLKKETNLSVDEFLSTQNLSSYSCSESIENTHSRGVISYFAREQKEQSYSCGDDRIVGLVPFFISDLYNSDVKSDPGLSSSSLGSAKSDSSKKESPDLLEAKEVAAGLSYYSKDMSEAYWFYNYYKINGPEKAVEKKAKSVNGQQICDSFYTDGSPKDLTDEQKQEDEDNTLKELGDMKILDVVAPGPKGSSWNTDNWNAILNSIQKDKKDAILKSIDKNTGNSDYYFIVARCNLEKLRTQYELSATLAEQYLGKYWYRRYTPIVGGGEENYKNVSIETADGSASFYSRGSDVSGHPIGGFGHEPGSYIDKLIKTIKEEEEDKDPKTGSFTHTSGSNVVTKEYEIRSSIIMAERDAKWYPNKNDVESYQHFAEYFQLERGLFLVGPDGRPDVLSRLYPCAKYDKGIVIFCVRRSEPLSLEITEIDNFYEEIAQKKIRRTLLKEARNSNKPYSQYRNIAKTGLRSRKTQWVVFDGFGFMMPVGGTSKIFASSANSTLSNWTSSNQSVSKFSAGEGSSASLPPSGDPYMAVRVTQDFNVPVTLPKIQKVFFSEAAQQSAVNSIDYYYFDMDSIENELLLGQCDVNLQSIEEAHKLAAQEYSVLNTSPQISINFSAFGIFPINVSIEQGLDSFTIVIGDNGTETTYVLSSKYREKPEGNILQNIVEKIGNRLSKKSIGGNLDGGYKSDKLPII
jgi:hypothetical protein